MLHATSIVNRLVILTIRSLIDGSICGPKSTTKSLSRNIKPPQVTRRLLLFDVILLYLRVQVWL